LLIFGKLSVTHKTLRDWRSMMKLLICDL